MRIFVCVKCVKLLEAKAVPGITNIAVVKGGGGQLKTINRPDRCALEQALVLKRQLDNVEVIVISFGPSYVREILEICLKMGADKAFHLESEDIQLDAYAVANELSKKIKRETFDLVLCGNTSVDWNGFQMAAILAHLLDVPQITGVIELEVLQSNNIVQASRKLKRGARQVVECNLPAVLAVEREIHAPRYISVHTRVKRFLDESLLEKVGVDCQAISSESLVELVDVGPKRPRTKKTIVPEQNMSFQDKMKFMKSGGVSSKKNNLLKGNVKEISRSVLDFLERENLLK
ncbi:electron transfer flavoprotein subunit beta/FixA family protein [Desulfosporosinus fructosivorans]